MAGESKGNDRPLVGKCECGAVRYQVADAFRLYDLEADEKESRDLAAAEPERVRELRQRLQAWSATLSPPRW
jgi:hypothetical protein